MTDENLNRLRELAAMKRDVDLQELSRIAGRMAALQAEIDAIRTKARARAESVALDPARLSGVDVMWERWVTARTSQLQQRMAQLALERETHLQKARTSFGRAEVLRKLSDTTGRR